MARAPRPHSSALAGSETLPFELARAARRKAGRRRCIHRASGKIASRQAPWAYSPTQRRGMQGEVKARQFLHAHGLTILGQNLRARAGEIDLVADHDGVLVFVEVRMRRSMSHGGAAASVDMAKQRRLYRAALAWMPQLVDRHYAGRAPACRFDVISLESGALNWIRHAFEAEYQ